MTTPGDGYGIALRAIEAPIKERPPEVKASIRRKALQRRMNKKYPLFASQFITDTIAARPGYYLEGTSEGDAMRREVLDAEAAEHARLTANPNTLFDYRERSC